MFRFFKKNKKNLNDTQSQSLRIDKVIEPGPKILREAAWNFLEDNIKISYMLKKEGYVNQKIIKMPHSFYFPTNSLLEGDTYVYIEASLD
tara:strand:+ start:331 stop:600 length:270 start_codon:yes stop_codon:yes gene_type:complete